MGTCPRLIRSRSFNPATMRRGRLANVLTRRLLGGLHKISIGLRLRQGEMLALPWRDFDFDAGTLTERHTRTSRTGDWPRQRRTGPVGPFDLAPSSSPRSVSIAVVRSRNASPPGSDGRTTTSCSPRPGGQALDAAQRLPSIPRSNDRGRPFRTIGSTISATPARRPHRAGGGPRHPPSGPLRDRLGVRRGYAPNQNAPSGRPRERSRG